MLRRVCLLFFLVGAPVLSAQDTPDATAAESRFARLFPSAGFEDRIAFWKMIFTRYGRDEVVLHDRDDVRLIYSVVNLPPGASVTSQRRQLRAERQRLNRAFDELIRLGPNSSRLSPAHTALLGKLKAAGLEPTPAAMRRLKKNVHSQRGIRERFQEGLVRSGRYLPELERIFAARGLPTELALLPHVESSFDYSAYSRKGAAGIWQITRSTGRRLLKIGRLVDERLDPLIAAEAAATLLRENFEALGTWPLAITAYNHGKNGMLRAQDLHGDDLDEIVENYESRMFGFASQNFYAEFLAAVQIARNPERDFPSLKQDAPLSFGTILIEKRASIRRVASRFGVTESLLRTYNPQLTRYFWRSSKVVPAGTKLKLPAGSARQLAQNSGSSGPKTTAPAESKRRYRVERGDTLLKIARKFEVGVEELTRANRIRDTRIYRGQLLVIP
jgi:membrane-bound lytic murein transglycosylase D